MGQRGVVDVENPKVVKYGESTDGGPWCAGWVLCNQCRSTWVGVFEVVSGPLDCPDCESDDTEKL